MTDMKPATVTSSDTTRLVKLTSERFAEDWRIWRAGWEQWLTRPFGWLAAVSVNWLDENPSEYAGVPGLWWQDEDAVFVDTRGMTMTVHGREFTGTRRIGVGDDGLEIRVGAGNVEIGITNRGGFMIVTYDPNSPLRTTFHGVPCYDPDPAWLLHGRFEPFDEPESITLGSVGSQNHDYGSPGVVRFTYHGTEYPLVALEAPGGGLNIVFKDATSGVTTYPACRSLNVEAPDERATVTLDFNRAVNLPCAFTDNFPICPVPPPQNQLPFPIEAGEKDPHTPNMLRPTSDS